MGVQLKKTKEKKITKMSVEDAKEAAGELYKEAK